MWIILGVEVLKLLLAPTTKLSSEQARLTEEGQVSNREGSEVAKGEEAGLDCEVKLATVPRHAKFNVTEIRIETEGGWR